MLSISPYVKKIWRPRALSHTAWEQTFFVLVLSWVFSWVLSLPRNIIKDEKTIMLFSHPVWICRNNIHSPAANNDQYSKSKLFWKNGYAKFVQTNVCTNKLLKWRLWHNVIKLNVIVLIQILFKMFRSVSTLKEKCLVFVII